MGTSNLSLQGLQCNLFKDDLKAKELNRGALLLPYNGDKSIMLDRYDCRGYLPNLYMYDQMQTDNPTTLSHEEWELEQSCDFERYYDLFHNKERCNDFKSDEIPKQEESCFTTNQVNYKTVGFDYGVDDLEEKADVKISVDDSEVNDSITDFPYIIPAGLKLPIDMTMPATEREAAIIEQTAKFVADKGAQLEILIKTKQSKNPRFQFLNFDHRLNPFYRYLVQLIKTAQYIPIKRHASHLVKGSIENGVSPSEPTLPKIDISSTPYGKLVERFKQNQEKKRLERENKVIADSGNKNGTVIGNGCTVAVAGSEGQQQRRSPSPTTVEMSEARQKMYESLYQQYYPYYYQYYLDAYRDVESHDTIVEMARNCSASSAVSWIQTNMPDTSNTFITERESEGAVMKKMAEYVVKNGPEFEQIMLTRNGDTFAFLRKDHPRHKKYLRHLARERRRVETVDGSPSPPPPPVKKREETPPQQLIDCIVDSYASSSDNSDNNDDDDTHSNSSTDSSSTSSSSSSDTAGSDEPACPISFKMSSVHKPTPVIANLIVQREKPVKAAATTTTANTDDTDDDDDDYDFTDNLRSRTVSSSIGVNVIVGPSPSLSSTVSTSSSNCCKKRMSRFSPANPKNIIAMTAVSFNDAQIQRKRKAAEMVASRLILEKTQKQQQDQQQTEQQPEANCT